MCRFCKDLFGSRNSAECFIASVSVSFYKMSGIQVTVYTVKIRRLFLLGIVKMCVLPFLGKLSREKVLMTLNAAAFINISPCIFKSFTSSQLKEAEFFVRLLHRSRSPVLPFAII